MKLSTFVKIHATLTIALAVSVGSAAAKQPATKVIEVDCQVIPYWCNPPTQDKDRPYACTTPFRPSDEYDFILDPVQKTVKWLDTPHVSRTISGASQDAPSVTATFSPGETAVSWANPPKSVNGDARYVLWLDTLRLEVTTYTSDGKAYWRGTCVKTTKQILN